MWNGPHRLNSKCLVRADGSILKCLDTLRSTAWLEEVGHQSYVFVDYILPQILPWSLSLCFLSTTKSRTHSTSFPLPWAWLLLTYSCWGPSHCGKKTKWHRASRMVISSLWHLTWKCQEQTTGYRELILRTSLFIICCKKICCRVILPKHQDQSKVKSYVL